MTQPDAADLHRLAHAAMRQRASSLHGVWPRAVALLGRQALETRIAELEPSLAQASGRARQLCLPALVGADLARDAAYAWTALSRATHHHAYDLPPTAEELIGWLAVVERLLDAPCR